MAQHKPGSSSVSPAPAFHEPPRRPFLYNLVTLVVGAIVGLVPLLTGLVVFFDPLRSRGGAARSQSGDWIRVATLAAVPPDGIPRQFPVIADQIDAWNRTPNQPVGSVYLRRVSADEPLECLNAICPHLGCFVAVVDRADGKCLGCPCHESVFKLDGELVSGVSPRDMDRLEIDQDKLAQTGEVWVDFKNFYSGTHERIEKT